MPPSIGFIMFGVLSIPWLGLGMRGGGGLGFMLGILKVFFVVIGALCCLYSGNFGAELYMLLNLLCWGLRCCPASFLPLHGFPIYVPNVSVYSNIMER